MRKIFIALAASLLISVGSAAHINQVPARSLAQALRENNEKHTKEYKGGDFKRVKGQKKERAQQEEEDEDVDQDDEEDQVEEEGDEEWWGENQDIDFDEQDDDFEFDGHKNAQGILGAIETAVNVGDEVARTVNPAIPTVKLTNQGNTVTLKVAGKLA